MQRHLAYLLLALLAILSQFALAGDSTSTLMRLKSCDPTIALAAAKEVIEDPATLTDPVKLFTPALVLFDQGKKEESIFWFYAAQLRTRYHAAIREGDYNQVLSIMLMTVGPPINTYAFQDVGRLDQILDQVLKWDRDTPNPLRKEVSTEEVEAKIRKVYLGLSDLRAKLKTDKVELEEKSKREWSEFRPMLEHPISSHCPKSAQPINPPDATR